MKSTAELRSQVERYRWLARNIGDEQARIVLEEAASELSKRVAEQAEPQDTNRPQL